MSVCLYVCLGYARRISTFFLSELLKNLFIFLLASCPIISTDENRLILETRAYLTCFHIKLHSALAVLGHHSA